MAGPLLGPSARGSLPLRPPQCAGVGGAAGTRGAVGDIVRPCEGGRWSGGYGSVPVNHIVIGDRNGGCAFFAQNGPNRRRRLRSTQRGSLLSQRAGRGWCGNRARRTRCQRLRHCQHRRTWRPNVCYPGPKALATGHWSACWACHECACWRWQSGLARHKLGHEQRARKIEARVVPPRRGHAVATSAEEGQEAPGLCISDAKSNEPTDSKGKTVMLAMDYQGGAGPLRFYHEGKSSSREL